MLPEFEIELTDADVAELSTDKKNANGVLTLGSDDAKDTDKKHIISELLPKVIARKLEGIIPSDYSISEICMNIKVSGSLFGQGVSGTVQVKFSPDQPDQ